MASAAAAVAYAFYRRSRNIVVHSYYNLPPLSFLLSMVPGSDAALLLCSPDGETLSAPCAPRLLEGGTSALPSELPTLRTNQQAVWRANLLLLHALGSRSYRTKIGRPPLHQALGSRSYSTKVGRPVRAVFSQMGTQDYDSNDRWTRLDIYMRKRMAFELIQGHPLIADSFMAFMWDVKSQKVLHNCFFLDYSNILHDVSIAASFVPENILVAENSSAVRLINPDGHVIDGVSCFTSDGIYAAVDMYFQEARKNQPQVSMPLDVQEFDANVSKLNKVMMTREQVEDFLYDAVFLDDPGLTAALHQSSLLLRVSYMSSNFQVDIDARNDALLELEKTVCRDGTVWATYVNSKMVPITEHFHNVAIQTSQKHRLLFNNRPAHERPTLLLIQEGHDQLGAQRNTGEHLNEKHNLSAFQHLITPTPQQQLAQQQVINPVGLQQVINPVGLQQVINPVGLQQVINPGTQQRIIIPRKKVLTTLQADPQEPMLFTVANNALAKYHRFHFPLTTGVIFTSLRKAKKSRQDINIPELFPDRKPRT